MAAAMVPGINDLQDLIDDLGRCTSTADAVEALSRYLATLGMEHFAYLGFQGGIGKGSEPFRAGRYPAAWIEEYMGDKLYTVDPLVLTAARSNLPVDWSADPGGNQGVVDPVLARAVQYGLRSGSTVPIRSSIGQLATLTFASPANHAEFERLMIEHRAALHLGAFHFHDTIERLRSPARSANLTDREHACLTLSAQGLLAKAIARTVGISPRSVKFHLDNARSKLGAANLRQAVTIASSLGLV